MTTPTTPRVLGFSSDNRTQKWRVVCPACGHEFTPPTTMLSTQTFDCARKRCGARLLARYNDEPPTVSLRLPQ